MWWDSWHLASRQSWYWAELTLRSDAKKELTLSRDRLESLNFWKTTSCGYYPNISRLNDQNISSLFLVDWACQSHAAPSQFDMCPSASPMNWLVQMCAGFHNIISAWKDDCYHPKAKLHVRSILCCSLDGRFKVSSFGAQQNFVLLPEVTHVKDTFGKNESDQQVPRWGSLYQAMNKAIFLWFLTVLHP